MASTADAFLPIGFCSRNDVAGPLAPTESRFDVHWSSSRNLEAAVPYSGFHASSRVRWGASPPYVSWLVDNGADVAALLAAGADPLAADDEGMTALTLIRRNRALRGLVRAAPPGQACKLDLTLVGSGGGAVPVGSGAYVHSLSRWCSVRLP